MNFNAFDAFLMPRARSHIFLIPAGTSVSQKVAKDQTRPRNTAAPHGRLLASGPTIFYGYVNLFLLVHEQQLADFK